MDINDSESIKCYHREFKELVWDHLTKEQKIAVINRFNLKVPDTKYESILKAFKTKIVPRAFCIASVQKLENPTDKEYHLADINPCDDYWELITYDEDKWGARRTDNKRYLGILANSVPPLPQEIQRTFEYLLRCSLALPKPNKLLVIEKAETFSLEQIDKLIETWEHELKAWYMASHENQKEGLNQQVEKIQKEWEEIEKTVAGT